tara:strand:+ start:2231 stop:2773 length:543 start_codon:yes stop_codon:yes gene_type:complete
MKKFSLIMLVLIVSVITSSAQAQDRVINNGFGFGFQLNQYQSDFGLGLNLTSPFFVNEKIAFRLRGNLMFNENIQNKTTWTPYSNVSLGLIGVGGKIGDFIRLYGEGGFIGLLPSDEFSSKQIVLGGYGLFGFEFFMNKTSNYFIEIGGVGTGAKEDKIATQPIYSNGLIISTGFRVHLK